MQMSFDAGALNWWQLVALLGALQGMLLAGALAVRPGGHTSHRLLAAAILSLALFLASVVYHSAALVGTFPHLFAITQPLPFLFGPLVYLYAVTAGDRDRRLHPRDAWHALPAALVLVLSIPIFLLSGVEKAAMYDAIRGGNGPGLVTMIDPLRLLSGGAYTVATFVVLQRHRQVVEDNYSSLDRVNLAWVRQLVVAAGGIWLLAFALELAGELNRAPAIEPDLLVATAITGLIQAVGYQGIRQPEIVRFNAAPDHIAEKHPPPNRAPPAHATNDRGSTRGRRKNRGAPRRLDGT